MYLNREREWKIIKILSDLKNLTISTFSLILKIILLKDILYNIYFCPIYL